MPLVDPYEPYLTAGTSFARLAPSSGTRLVYGLFNEDPRPMLPFVDTGLVYCKNPELLKYFKHVRFGGTGKLYIRAMVDNTEVQRGWVVLSDDPNQASTFRLPKGTAGYGLRLQLAGIAWWRYYDITWDPVSAQGQS
jgi:hypothetical protein